jgi:AcrR family transcriptional regulator
VTEATTTDTRVAIIVAALKCFQTKGLRKTTVVDITRAAGMSRSTVYEYFPDKAAIVAACAEHVSQLFYREMALAMDRGRTLEDRLGRAGAVVTRGRQFIEPEKYFDADEVNLLLTKNAAQLLRECGEFLTPYLTAAKLTGEVRRDLDVEAAAEWFSRILFSLFTTPSARLDTTDPQVVSAFVREHAVRGFAGQSPSRPRRNGQ